MNFQVSLWNNFELVNNHFTARRKGFKEFIYMLSEKQRYDSEYAKGMKKLYELNSVVTHEGTLGQGMNSARDYFVGLFTYYSELAFNVKNEILEPAKKFLEEQNTIGKKLYNDINKSNKDYKDSVNTLEKMKMKFLSAAKVAEMAKLDAEMAKLTYITPQEKEKFNYKANNAMKEAKDAEKAYINSLNTANSAREMFIETSKSSLFNFQLLEEEFIEFCKNMLRKLFIYSNATAKNTLYDTEKVYQKVEEINMNFDINTFIEVNQTIGVNCIPPLPIEYVPYSLNLRSKPIEEFTYPAEAVFNVIVSLNSLFERTNDNFDPVEEKKKIQINEMSKLACKGDNFSEENKTILFNLLKEKKYRLHFLSYLNKYRTNGIFEISKSSFEIIGEVMKQILDVVINDKDYESARYCIILSQTYHYIDEGAKVSLQKKIEGHGLLKMVDFWENFIAYSIFEEIEKQNCNSPDSNSHLESEDDKNNRISNIVFSQLLPITDNMLGFEVDKEKIKEIILAFSKQYNISQELNQHLISMVDEFVYEKKEENPIEILPEEVKKVNENLDNLEICGNSEEKNSDWDIIHKEHEKSPEVLAINDDSELSLDTPVQHDTLNIDDNSNKFNNEI